MQNKAILIGNTGKDAEHFESNGFEKVSFSLATSKKWRDRETGEKKDATEWHNIVVTNKHLIPVVRNIAKGTKLYIEGEIRYRSYEKDGQKRYVTEIVIPAFGGEVVFLEAKGDGGSGGQASSYY